MWWSQGGSNSRPLACKASALPAELWPLENSKKYCNFYFCKARATEFMLINDQADNAVKNENLVGLGGFEPPTSPLSGVRSNQLSYRPKLFVYFLFFCVIFFTQLVM